MTSMRAERMKGWNGEHAQLYDLSRMLKSSKFIQLQTTCTKKFKREHQDSHSIAEYQLLRSFCYLHHNYRTRVKIISSMKYPCTWFSHKQCRKYPAATENYPVQAYKHSGTQEWALIAEILYKVKPWEYQLCMNRRTKINRLRVSTSPQSIHTYKVQKSMHKN